MTKQYHIHCDVGDVAPYVLMPGDPGRADYISSFFDESSLIARNREFTTYTGKYKGVPITVTSTGIGCPSAAIALEELAKCGAETFIRVGTCGTFQDLALGDLAIATGAVRNEGTTERFVNIRYPAVADICVTLALIESAHSSGLGYHVGIFQSDDALYAGSGFKGYNQSIILPVEDAKKARVLAADMESSALFVLSNLYGLRAGTIALIVNRIGGGLKPEEEFYFTEKALENLCRTACDSVKVLNGWDVNRKNQCAQAALTARYRSSRVDQGPSS
jgi:uridine phosphorylase